MRNTLTLELRSFQSVPPSEGDQYMRRILNVKLMI